MNVQVYVGCGLTHAPQEYRDMISSFITKLKSYHWITVLEFCAPKQGEKQSSLDEGDVYDNDIHHCVEKADIIISEVQLPSSGLGYEIAVAVEKLGTRVIMCAKEDAIVSKLILGSAKRNKNVSFVRYKDTIDELLPYFLEQLMLMEKKVNK